MKTQIKVAGTTFHPLPEGKTIMVTETFEANGIPCARAQMVLEEEPQNPYDPEAVKVLVPLTDGSAFHLGYLPKTEPVKRQIRGYMMGTLEIHDYRSAGTLNPSFVITEIQGL